MIPPRWRSNASMAHPRALLLIVDDHFSEAVLRQVLAERVGKPPRPITVLTADALLCMRLRREGFDAVLPVDGLDPQTIDERDQRALGAISRAYQISGGDCSIIDGISYGSLFTYTLIPKFMRTVRHLYAVHDALARHAPADLVVIGRGELAAAALIVADTANLTVHHAGTGLWARIRLALQRVLAGRRTRWTNTSFRALVLEPGFLLLLSLRGLFVGHPKALTDERPTLIVAGDRFTADAMKRARESVGEIIVAGATLPGRRLFRRFSSSIPLEAYGRWTDVLALMRIWSAATGRAVRLLSENSLRRRELTFRLEGWHYWRLVRWTVAFHLVAWIPILHHTRRLVLRALQDRRSAKLLVSNDVTAYNRLLVDAAHTRGVPSLGIQHGILAEPNGHDAARVDTLATWGAASEMWYRAHADQHTRFVVTGNPRFDELAARPAPLSRRSGLFTVVVCTGFVQDLSIGATEFENLLMLDAVIAWATSHQGARVVLKMHPGEEPQYYESAARQLAWPAAIFTAVRDISLYDLLERSDVLVAAYSTTVFEAMVLGTPAIVLDAITRRHLLPLEQAPGATIAFEVSELHAELDRLRERSAVNDAPHAPSLTPFLIDYLHAIDSYATDRVADLLLSTPAAPDTRD